MVRSAAGTIGTAERRTPLLLGVAIAACAVPFVLANGLAKPAPLTPAPIRDSGIALPSDAAAATERPFVNSAPIVLPRVAHSDIGQSADSEAERSVERRRSIAPSKVPLPIPHERAVTAGVPIAALASGSRPLVVAKVAMSLVPPDLPLLDTSRDEEPRLVAANREPERSTEPAMATLATTSLSPLPLPVVVSLGPPPLVAAPVETKIDEEGLLTGGKAELPDPTKREYRSALLDPPDSSPLPLSAPSVRDVEEDEAHEARESAPKDRSSLPASSSEPPATAVARSEQSNALDPRVDVAQIAPAPTSARIAQLSEALGKSRLAVRYAGREIGTVAFQVEAGHSMSVHIGQVLDLFEGRFDADRFAYLRGSGASEQYVAIDRLQAAGIPIRYDPVYDEIVLSPNAG